MGSRCGSSPTQSGWPRARTRPIKRSANDVTEEGAEESAEGGAGEDGADSDSGKWASSGRDRNTGGRRSAPILPQLRPHSLDPAASRCAIDAHLAFRRAGRGRSRLRCGA
jgi:hypothetical protein